MSLTTSYSCDSARPSTPPSFLRFKNTLTAQGTVVSMMVEPASVPTPTDSSCYTASRSFPRMPDTSIIIESGSAPSTGNYIPPMIPGPYASYYYSHPSASAFDALPSM
uniref:Keratin, type I cytoskeletal 18 n=1 Tax=Lygus hesperus TaxID=30085 RepID=A0A0A9W9L9_LYGHE